MWSSLDIYESVSRQLQALGVPQQRVSDSAGVLVNYILGVAGQNAANARALAGIDLILAGIETVNRAGKDDSAR